MSHLPHPTTALHLLEWRKVELLEECARDRRIALMQDRRSPSASPRGWERLTQITVTLRGVSRLTLSAR